MTPKEIRNVFRKAGLLDENGSLCPPTTWPVPREKPTYWLIADGSSVTDAIDQLNEGLFNARLERIT